MLFAFNDEIVLKTLCIGLIAIRLKISGLCRSRNLLSHFFKLRAEHVHVTAQSVIARGSIRMNKIAAKRDMKPVSLLTFDHKVATG